MKEKTKIRIRAISIFLSIVVCIASGIYYYRLYSESKRVEEILAVQPDPSELDPNIQYRYEDPDERFRFSHYQNWAFVLEPSVEIPGNEYIIGLVPAVTDSYTSFAVTKQEYQGLERITPDEYFESLVDSLSQTLDEFTFVEREKTTATIRNKLYAKYQFLDNDGQTIVQQIKVFFMDDFIYVLTATSTKGQFDKHKKAIEYMIGSFEMFVPDEEVLESLREKAEK